MGGDNLLTAGLGHTAFMDSTIRTDVRPRPPAVRRTWTPVVAVAVVLAAWNVVGNLLVPDALYVPANIAVGTLLLIIAWASGTSLPGLGLDRTTTAAGWRLGALGTIVMVGVVLLATAVPTTRAFLEDARFVDVSLLGALYQAAIRIPLGTALFEEVAFRGVLLGMLMERMHTGRAAVLSSVLFGLWHIIPTAALLDINKAGDFAAAAVIVGGVVATAVAGLGFVWFRLRSGSLVAPIVVHAAINAAAYSAGWLIVSG